MRAWIDLEKRKPPQDVYVLISIYDYRPKVNMSHVEIAARIGDYWIEPVAGDKLNLKNRVVTHWMPLPEPPEQNRPKDVLLSTDAFLK